MVVTRPLFQSTETIEYKLQTNPADIQFTFDLAYGEWSKAWPIFGFVLALWSHWQGFKFYLLAVSNFINLSTPEKSAN